MLGLLLVIGYIQAQSSVLSPSYDATTSHYRLQRNTNQRIRSKNHILHLKPSLKVKAAHHDNDYSLNEDEDLNPRQMNDVLEQLSTNDLDNIGFVEDPAEEYESGSGIEKRVEEYESWSASEKMDYLVNQINSDHNTLPIYGVLDTLGLFTESMAPTFAKTPDIMTKDRKKLIHTYFIIYLFLLSL